MRPSRSAAPPAPNGTTTRTGRFGQSCVRSWACETGAPNTRAAKAIVVRPMALNAVILCLPPAAVRRSLLSFRQTACGATAGQLGDATWRAKIRQGKNWGGEMKTHQGGVLGGGGAGFGGGPPPAPAPREREGAPRGGARGNCGPQKRAQ